MSDIDIVEVESFEQLVALEGLVERIFGAGQRASGWFRRKLIREGIEAGLSAVAIDRGEACGCVLVGPASTGCVRGSLIGVEAPLRRRGVGRALIDFADARARAAGFEQLEFLSEEARVDWYLHQGFVLVEQQLAMCASGLGPRDDLPIGIEAAPRGSDPLWTWLPELWMRTPSHERAYLELDAAKVWLSREGRAWLAQRFEGDREHVAMHIEQLRRRVAIGTPLLLYPCKADTPLIDALASIEFAPVQRSSLVRR